MLLNDIRHYFLALYLVYHSKLNRKILLFLLQPGISVTDAKNVNCEILKKYHYNERFLNLQRFKICLNFINRG